MATRKPSPTNRAVRPAAEDLESRYLLSQVVSGIDNAGNSWTLQLLGRGSLTVVKQIDPTTGAPGTLTSPTEINQIIVGGTDPKHSRLVGHVTKGPNGTGQVFFQNLTELTSRSELLGAGNGLLAINMPNFYLGNTTPASSTSIPTMPSISIPDGVDTLRFGGVDTTHDQVIPPASTSATFDNYAVALGLPLYGGTRIIIDKSVSSIVPLSGSTTPTYQHAVTFNVSGRLDLFQANSIQGDATTPPGQFSRNNPSATGFGGTWVFSGTTGTVPFLETTPTPPFQNFVQNLQGAVTGAIGNVRIGGNATNFTTIVNDATGSGNARIANFSIGGETDNVLLLAPNGARNISFGLGMDKVDILTNVINTLQANRGALSSRVLVGRTISKVTIGGDVDHTQVETGLQQNFPAIFQTLNGTTTTTPSAQPEPPPDPINAQVGGGMTVLVAGDVTDSVFTASVQPLILTTGSPPTTPGTVKRIFGTQDVTLPTGHILAKVEGTISNEPGAVVNSATDTTTNITSATINNSPINQAFYAADLHLKQGPVIPPNVPEQPYPPPARPVHAPGIPHLGQMLMSSTNSATTVHGASVPKGPSNTSTSKHTK
ncbi:MAG: hypothetical protein JOZ63_16300 [Planctomycetaceae bacterium]|nr:hypothetical protein [Planctomycetaceae bacterium]